MAKAPLKSKPTVKPKPLTSKPPIPSIFDSFEEPKIRRCKLVVPRAEAEPGADIAGSSMVDLVLG